MNERKLKPSTYLTRRAAKYGIAETVYRDTSGYAVGDKRIGINVRQARSALYKAGPLGQAKRKLKATTVIA